MKQRYICNLIYMIYNLLLKWFDLLFEN